MTAVRIFLASSLVLLALVPVPRAARAAESYDNCTGFIDSLPATISTQGVWCLHHDLATNISAFGGAAIAINGNNVTIDCNDFKIGDLAAGPGSQASGIFTDSHQNITIRHCNIRGFGYGIVLQGGAGHLVEDNRLDNNLYGGIEVFGEHNRVRRNAVYDTGSGTGSMNAYGIWAFADITDNTVSGLSADIGGGTLKGISANAAFTRVEGNAISGFDLVAGDGTNTPGAIGIDVEAMPMTIAGNRIFGPNLNAGYGIKGYSASTNFCVGNTVTGFFFNIDTCNTSGSQTYP